MKEYEVMILSGEINLNHNNKSITKYQDFKWGEKSDILKAAEKGSLCSRIFLKNHT